MATAGSSPLPLLLFGQPKPVSRGSAGSGWPQLHEPSLARQGERLLPQFQVLRDAFEARRLELHAHVPNADPDLVLVFETTGAAEDFIAIAQRVNGLEWLAAASEVELVPDDDFYDEADHQKTLTGKLFLIGSNRRALDALVRLWERFLAGQSLSRGLGYWGDLFTHLKQIRYWGPQDRLDADLRRSWLFRLDQGDPTIRFEIEAWHHASPQRNAAAFTEVRTLVEDLGGQILDRCFIGKIAYHGFLVSMPADGVRRLLDGSTSPLLRSDRVMFFRPQGQALASCAAPEPPRADAPVPDQPVSGPPVVALLDGLPVANHPRLQGRVQIADLDGWEHDYLAEERVHGTAMASLICWGELDAAEVALPSPLYVHPILRPSGTGRPRQERTPENRLLIDLVHVAVNRMFETAVGKPAAAPGVRVINLSVGDSERLFASELSPWARLLDWLSHKHKVLFVVSCGNAEADLVLSLQRESVGQLPMQDRSAASMTALLKEDMQRKLFAPAESVNALTVGACHSDASRPQAVPGRHLMFPDQGLAPYSCIGPGFRRSVKPDILMPGGRVLYREDPASAPDETRMRMVNVAREPGHLVAAPPTQAGDVVYSRGTSNAAALASRAGGQAYAVLETLRANDPDVLPVRYDAVLIKALLAHGAGVGDLAQQILAARPDVESGQRQRRLISRYAGYGLADVSRALTCTERRATMLGFGKLKDDKAWEFHVPVPEALDAVLLHLRLTVTLAWLTPINPRHSKYRMGRLWVDLPEKPLGLARRKEIHHQQVKAGTLQHEIFEGTRAMPVADGETLAIRVNAIADAGKLLDPVDFALCVSLEVAEGVEVDLPIYQQVSARLKPKTKIRIGARAGP